MASYSWRRGSTFQVPLFVRSGMVTGEEAVRCAVKKRGAGGEPTGDELITLDMVFVPALSGTRDGWLVTGTAQQGIGLAPGYYIADARIPVSETVIITERATIHLEQTVTTT